jgi:hypothetical protein
MQRELEMTDTAIDGHRRRHMIEPNAKQFLRMLCKELLSKHRQRNTSDESGSSDDSEDDRGEGEMNKKKRVYQSQLPWYTAEVEVQGREVDENRNKTRETLGVFQKDLGFAEREIR